MSGETSLVKLAVLGAGLIGERHAKLISIMDGLELAAIIDPSDRSVELAKSFSTSHYSQLNKFLSEDLECDGIVIATPNETHREFAIACLENKLPCLIEKPLAANSEDAKAIAEKSQESGIPVLVGHHRRHHTVSQNLKAMLDTGDIGQIVGAQLSWMLRKPDDYFEAGAWRTKKGGGPIWINLIHEIDLLRYFLGEIVEVSAMLGNSIRGNEVEDTGIINMRFQNGALASAIVSDCAPSPWHFEGGSGENPNIAETGRGGLRIFGTTGSIEFPSLHKWQHKTDQGHWGDPIIETQRDTAGVLDGEIALTAQLQHFVDLIKQLARPLVSARDGLQSVRVVETIHRSALSGKMMTVELN